jgi:hypothetical protein
MLEDIEGDDEFEFLGHRVDDGLRGPLENGVPSGARSIDQLPDNFDTGYRITAPPRPIEKPSRAKPDFQDPSRRTDAAPEKLNLIRLV